MIDTTKFTGKSYKVYKKGEIHFTKYLGKTLDNQDLYEIVCTECSKDKELYPFDSFLTTLKLFSEGNLPCSCSPTPNYTECQKSIIDFRLSLINPISRGFDPKKPAYLYLVLWEGSGEKFFKVGVTNNKVDKRFSQQKSKTNSFSYTCLDVYYNSNGKIILSLEKDLLNYRKNKLSATEKSQFQNIFPDGYTETFPYNKDIEVYLLNFFSKIKQS